MCRHHIVYCSRIQLHFFLTSSVFKQHFHVFKCFKYRGATRTVPVLDTLWLNTTECNSKLILIKLRFFKQDFYVFKCFKNRGVARTVTFLDTHIRLQQNTILKVVLVYLATVHKNIIILMFERSRCNRTIPVLVII